MHLTHPATRSVLVAFLFAGSLIAAPFRAPAAPAVDAPTPDEPSVSGGGTPFPSATPQAVVDVTAKEFPSVDRLDVPHEI